MIQRRLDRIGRLLWDDLPLIYFLFLAVAAASTECLNLSPPRRDLSWTFVFPLAVPVVLYALRFRTIDYAERLFGLVVLLGALSILALIFLSLKPQPIAVSQLRLFYEYSSLANTLFLGLHAWRRSRALAILFFVPVAVYGVILENGGILFGYFSETGYHLYLWPFLAPLATMAGWITVFYLVMSVTWEFQRCNPWLSRSAFGSALVATTCALCLDLSLDPLATAVGFWRWNDLLTFSLLGVPVHNFVAWASAVFPFSLLLFRLQIGRSIQPVDLGKTGNQIWLFLRIPLALAAASVLFFGSMAVIEEGFSGPTFAVLEETLRKWSLHE
ncbi:MAG: hypothetical protein A4E72_01440 [Syntrophus sp. PtaU1.Bin208]|nr:MAG: hypothetical protein A4E72_01440 [Syntrophus sp. PtaU1.Bin208]